MSKAAQRPANNANTLEENLSTKPMQSCKLEDIWKVEANKYSMLIPVGSQFGPKDVKVTVKDSIMTVVVKKEKFSQYDPTVSLGFEGFGKSFSVPRDGDFQKIRSTFTADGNLRIEVPKSSK